MIKGFDKETQPLNDYEREVLMPLVIRGLKNHVGKENSITNSAICKALKSQQYAINDVRLRKIINYIRVRGLLPGIIATSNGYYVATNKAEVEDYIKSLESRENAIGAVRKSLTQQLNLML